MNPEEYDGTEDGEYNYYDEAEAEWDDTEEDYNEGAYAEDEDYTEA